MAKVIGPLFSMQVSGAIGEIIFDRRGFVRRKGHGRDAKTSNQGDFRQAMRAAQQCVKLCGPQTRQQLRQMSAEPARWSAYLLKQLMGPNRTHYNQQLSRYLDPVIEQTAWETAALSLGLRPVKLAYAQAGEVTPGAQLFLLAATLGQLGLYPELTEPLTHPAQWPARIIA